MTIDIITFGCRLNAFESEQIKDAAIQAGLENTTIINSCAVTSEAERQLVQTIRKLHKTNPHKKIIVTGCAAQLNPEKYSSFKEVNKVIGNKEKTISSSYTIVSEDNKADVGNIMNVDNIKPYPVKGFDGKARGYIQVQNGCNHRCTFCSIPFARGNSRSLPVGAVIEQAKILVENGYKELVLTGVDITDYGLDLPGKPALGELVWRLLKNIPSLCRLRLSSLDVAEIDPLLKKIIVSENRIMPHVHLSAQAGDNMILKRMKRRHNREQIIDFCHEIHALRPEIAFGADIIAGFPTETDEMFINTYEMIKEANIIHLHVFPYSERAGTPASRMPKVPKAIRKERAKALRELGQKLLHQHLLQQLNKPLEIIVENHTFARARDYSPVFMPINENMQAGELHTVIASQVINNQLIASLQNA